ncbi:uncharacterized protein LOC131043747 [Cryptomeria japonica]|uniref:uncharacterized protein LOC131043747 n=1 Tax=Cryptomeria japonica TaxID=3369 RepID=UPI0027D9F251|nr:uncharacterized protein LOC131043747 [Cryptomeria japonica]
MKIVSWNVRGLNAPNKQRVIKRRILLVNVDTILLQETKLDSQQSVSFGNGISSLFHASLQLTVASEGAFGGLMIIWKPSQVQVEGIASSRSWLLARITHLQSNTSFFVFNNYGPVSPLKKRFLWLSLDGIISQLVDEQLIIAGDFNAIQKALDKRGGIIRLGGSQQDFNDWIDRNGLLEIDSGDSFTWTNRRKGFNNIAEKFDRFLWQGDFSYFPFAFAFAFACVVLPCSGSNHFPICLSLKGNQATSRSPFRFENMWMKDPNFLALIENWWKEEVFVGSKLFCFISKLKLVKQKLLQWNAQHFKNIFGTKKSLEERVAALNDKIILVGMDQESFDQEKNLLLEYEDILSKEENLLETKV